MDLQIGYESVEPWPLRRTDAPIARRRAAAKGKSKDLFEESAGPSARREADAPKPRLKADKDNGIIELDTQTQLSGIPAEAWTYRLGNRSALEWVLDQHKEKVIDLLMRVTRVSVETMAIVEAMKSARR